MEKQPTRVLGKGNRDAFHLTLEDLLFVEGLKKKQILDFLLFYEVQKVVSISKTFADSTARW
jgi:hypothetical protein